MTGSLGQQRPGRGGGGGGQIPAHPQVWLLSPTCMGAMPMCGACPVNSCQAMTPKLNTCVWAQHRSVTASFSRTACRG